MRLVCSFSEVAPDHRSNQIVYSQGVGSLRENPATVAQNGHSLAEAEDLLETVRDEEHRGAVVAECRDHVREPIDLGGR
jgi:hypothetical protein